MLTTIIHTKASIESILLDHPDGVNREYILNPMGNTRLDLLVTFANEIKSRGQKSFIEVKFQSKYTDRNRRLEVIGLTDDKCYIYKFSSYGRFDKDAIEIDRISKELLETFPFKRSYVPSLILRPSDNIDFIKVSLHNMNLNINIVTK
jgi:hypothetical protein